jgi:hypothetical protein
MQNILVVAIFTMQYSNALTSWESFAYVQRYLRDTYLKRFHALQRKYYLDDAGYASSQEVH